MTSGGFTLCAGIVLIGIGISFLVSCDSSSSNPTCDAEGGCGSNDGEQIINVQFDGEYLRTDYYREGEQRSILSVHMGLEPDGDGPLTHSKVLSKCNEVEPVCAELKYSIDTKTANLSLTVKKTVERSDVTCYETTWDGRTDDIMPTDCVQMSDFWFGGAEMYYQDWPINSWKKHMSFYLSGDMFNDSQQYGSVLERYWLSSQGVALWVPPSVPLHVSIEKQQICFKGAYGEPYKFRNEIHPHHWLQYTTCFAKTPQIVHDFIFKTYFTRPSSLPDSLMIKSPIWSTWARYKVNINESVVLGYAHEILDHGFSNSQLEIDDGYEVRYGDHTFDPEKFPNASGMIDTLHELGFRVTTWVTPFINPRSANYEMGDNDKHFILNGATNKSGTVPWWNGLGSSIDFTNSESCDWYATLLENVKESYGVDSFKFDAGEINYVTVIRNYQTHLEMENLGTYTKMYAQCAYARLGTQIEIRAAWDCQGLPIFVRMMDKDSNWGRAKGLKTLIPTALTFSLIGYPYILPDMIGGNAYEDGFHGTPLPEKELFIRWLEITAFLPSMQFSYVPWQYDDDTVAIAKKFVTLHESYVYEELVKASNEYIRREAGIGPIRPIWWVTLDDPRAFVVDDEFLVGDRYLVAPIVEQGARSRDVYLPGPLSRDGSMKLVWVDKMNKRQPVLGGTTIYDYPIELDEISWWELTLK